MGGHRQTLLHRVRDPKIKRDPKSGRGTLKLGGDWGKAPTALPTGCEHPKTGWGIPRVTPRERVGTKT